ncbi:hypothetical protein Pmani_028794 [Petrolisthes manimaculis]|uniref:Uncharacterized protein n=1 Tax=Petrolisthes manimaculis TaxID=1843537 RepID=A0AAE1TV49_9EUCA|nr:hypothetical protein Pmani_028794 [Petrolisthes manimaculis]
MINKHISRSLTNAHKIYNQASVFHFVYDFSLASPKLNSLQEEKVEAETDRPDHPPHHSGLSKLASVAERPFPLHLKVLSSPLTSPALCTNSSSTYTTEFIPPRGHVSHLKTHTSFRTHRTHPVSRLKPIPSLEHIEPILCLD